MCANIKVEFVKLSKKINLKEEEFNEFLDIAKNLSQDLVNFEEQTLVKKRMIH